MKKINQHIICLEKNHLNLLRLKSLIKLIFNNENLDHNMQLNIVITNDQSLRELNKEFRNIDSPTDVLSFPSEDKFLPKEISILGEIYISIERAKEQAPKYQVSLQSEVERLITHGILHLIGYTHQDEKDLKTMTKRTEYYLNKLCETEQ